jgi:chitin disaccharide deacetylase
MRHPSRGVQTGQPRRRRVHADDCGRSAAVHAAVLRAFTEGGVTSDSRIVTGEAFEHAVRVAHAYPDLAIGIHLVTVMGRAVLPPAVIPTLVDASGNFVSNPTRAGLKYYFSPQARQELRQELRAQFDKFVATGLRLSHIDGHLHMHVHPVIFRAALELGLRYGVRRMRVPQEEYRLAVNFRRQDAGKKALHTLLFGLLARRMKRQLRAADFVYAERVYGNLHSGQIDEQYVLYMLDHLHATTNEIYFHPAVYPADCILSAAEQQCMREFAALTSPSVCHRVHELGIELMSYFDLEENQ